MFGMEVFMGRAGVANLIFCIAVSILAIVVPFAIYRIRGKMNPGKTKAAENEPAA